MSRGTLLTPPHAVGLPRHERERLPPAQTLALAAERWPEIERRVADGHAAEAIAALEALAAAMRAATAHDPPLYRDALLAARLLAYDDLAQVGRSLGAETAARAALARAAAGDPEGRPHIERLLAEG